MKATQTDSISLREILVFYYRYRTRLWLAFWLPFLAIIVLSFVPVPRYEASSVLIVRLGSEYVYQPEVTNNRNGPEATIPFDRDQIFKSEVAILNSDDLHKQVIETLAIGKLYPNIITPGLLSPLTDYLQGLFASLGLMEQASDEQIKQRQLAKALARFDKRLDIQLEKESAVITLSFQHADSALAVQTLDTLLKLYMEKRKQLYLEPRVEMAEAQVAAMQTKAAMAAAAVENFKAQHKIYSLPDQRATLLQERAELDRKRATVTSTALDQKISFFNYQLDQLDKFEREYDRLQHEKQIAEDEYALATHKRNEASAFEDLQRDRAGSIRIIQPPSAPAEPRRWQWLIILIGFFVSLLSALGIAAATEFAGRGFLTPERLERRIGLPVLAVISERR